ncbi:MAG: transposase [Chloroflexi bacterium]|uniref:Transposase n=1 Tax=Candidatus Chlorohelix allophototropha TaxID=3003348 RepID=A0A8T7M0L4_9CHLR|nr:transposase [Chloroflexota bacterium]
MDWLERQHQQVLLFAYRFEAPLDTNFAERAIRTVKIC